MLVGVVVFVFFFKQNTAYEMRISDWSSDVCSSDLGRTKKEPHAEERRQARLEARALVQASALAFGLVPARRSVVAGVLRLGLALGGLLRRLLGGLFGLFRGGRLLLLRAQRVGGDLPLAHLGEVDDEVDHLVLEERRAELGLGLRVGAVEFHHLVFLAGMALVLHEQSLVNLVLGDLRSEEHTSELQSLMRISYAVFCLTHKLLVYRNL